jgi:hypothetical protein
MSLWLLEEIGCISDPGEPIMLQMPQAGEHSEFMVSRQKKCANLRCASNLLSHKSIHQEEDYNDDQM